MDDSFTSRGAHRLDIVADGEGGLGVAALLHGVGDGSNAQVEGRVGEGRTAVPNAGKEGSCHASHVCCESRVVTRQHRGQRRGGQQSVVDAICGGHSAGCTVAGESPPVADRFVGGHFGRIS